MKEIIHTLKSLGPNFWIEWKWDFHQRELIMRLRYVNSEFPEVKATKEFPFKNELIEANENNKEIFAEILRRNRDEIIVELDKFYKKQ